MTRCIIGRDEADYRRRLQRVARITGDDPASEGATWIAGPPDRARASLEAFREAGVERFFLQHFDYTDLEGVALFAAVLGP